MPGPESLVNIAHFGKIAVVDVQNRPQPVENSKSDQYRSSSETGMCWMYWAAFASTPPRGCRAQQITTASASPSWGRFFGYGRKRIPARKGLAFPMQRSWGLRVQSSGAAASCLVNRGQLGKPRRARHWARLFRLGLLLPNDPRSVGAFHAILHSTANCEPRCAHCNR
jgi:hypothetical protein